MADSEVCRPLESSEDDESSSSDDDERDCEEVVASKKRKRENAGAGDVAAANPLQISSSELFSSDIDTPSFLTNVGPQRGFEVSTYDKRKAPAPRKPWKSSISTQKT